MISGLPSIALCLISSLAATPFVSAAPAANSTSPIVDLGYAQYQGYFDAQTNITSFLSIRYAAPPVGKLRFQAPQPPATVAGVQPATENPGKCYQIGYWGDKQTAPVSPYGFNRRQSTASTTPPASEDCLFLNVFVPGNMPGEPATTDGLPVLVWIHGGGYGAESAARYNGADLVMGSLDSVIIVVIQYRLGAFGFLSGNEVKAQGALNAGLLDQAYALQWVQDHIGLFGGDKSHVTIWGESAGAGSVLQHIVANGGNTQPPLFNAAITSSTFLPSQYYYNDRVPQLLYNQVVEMTGCASSAENFTCLVSVPAETLQTAINYVASASAFFGTSVFVPVVDGTFIVERPTVTIASGQVNGQFLLAVCNRNEGTIFVDANETLSITDYVSQLFPDMTSLQVQEAAYIYRDYGTPLEQASTVMGDSIFVCPTYYLLQAFAGRSWKGHFAIPPAYHGADLAYYFNDIVLPLPLLKFNNTQFITAFSHSFFAIARSYDVNAKFDPTNITPHWHHYDIGRTEMLFNKTEAGTPLIAPSTTDPAVLERCAFWSTVTAMTAQ